MKKDTERFQQNAKEYMEFVKTNYRFPNSTDRFSSGTLMYCWRRWATGIIKDEEIRLFDKEWSQKIEDNRKEESKKNKLDAFYDKVTGTRLPKDPQTLEEYLNGDNRFLYFDVQTYVKIMEYIEDNSPEIPYLRFITILFGSKFNWRKFHHQFNLNSIIQQVDSAINDLKSEDHRKAIIHHYGLCGNAPRSLADIGREYGVGRDCIRCRELKALRLLRHPTRLSKIRRVGLTDNEISEAGINSIGHYIAVYSDDKNGVRQLLGVSHMNPYQIDEALEEIGYSVHGYDLSNPDAPFRIRSVNMYDHIQEDVPSDIFEKLNLSLTVMMGRNRINYTVVLLEKIPGENTFEYYLEEYRNHLREKSGHEALMRQMGEERSSIRPDIMFSYRFTTEVAKILDSIELDNCYKWLKVFNDKMGEIKVPRRFLTLSSSIIERLLNDRLKAFSIRCLYYKHDEDSCLLQLKRNIKR